MTRRRAPRLRRSLVLVLLSALALTFAWALRAEATNWLVCSAITATQSDPVRAHGIAVEFPSRPGPWAEGILMGDVGSTLSEALRRPMQGAVYTRIASASWGRGFTRFQDPTSPYYQVWVGVYVILDGPDGAHLGFDAAGGPLIQECLALFEADQRLALPWAGSTNAWPGGNRVEVLTSTCDLRPVTVDGQEWWRVSGAGETWALFHRGQTPGTAWPFYAFMGVVPLSADRTPSDYEPLTYHGIFYLRHADELGATVCKFYVIPQVGESAMSRADSLAEVEMACERILQGLRVRSK